MLAPLNVTDLTDQPRGGGPNPLSGGREQDAAKHTLYFELAVLIDRALHTVEDRGGPNEPNGSAGIRPSCGSGFGPEAPSKTTWPEIVAPGLVVMTRPVMSLPSAVTATDAASSVAATRHDLEPVIARRHVADAEASIGPHTRPAAHAEAARRIVCARSASCSRQVSLKSCARCR